MESLTLRDRLTYYNTPIIIVDPNRRYGGHCSLEDTLMRTISNDELHFCHCRQIYLGSPMSFKIRDISDTDRKDTLNHCVSNDKTFYVHGNLTINLAKEQWQEPSRNTINKTLRQIKGLPAACVIHIGKQGTMSNVVNQINMLQIERGIHDRVPYTLLLECAAGQGGDEKGELGKSWDELRKLYEGLDREKVGLCLDTQHIFASGMSKLDSHEAIVKLFDEAESITNSGVSLFHINDSNKPFGSRVDRHAGLRKGYIWNNDDTGLKALINRCFDSEIDLVSEGTPTSDIKLIAETYDI